MPHPKHVQKKREDFQMMKELSAECVGTFMLVASVCGSALFSAPNVGFMAVAFSIGTAVLAMAYAVGPISGAHFNPAVLTFVQGSVCKSVGDVPFRARLPTCRTLGLD
jgi:glycerol uptake facilitator-like aquaporin